MKPAAGLEKTARVYVIGSAEGPQKIGIANNPIRRLAALQTGNHNLLSVSETIHCTRDLAPAIERYAHWLLRENHARGEWFSISPAEAKIALHAAHEAVLSGKRAPTKDDSDALRTSMVMTREWVDAIDAFRRDEPGLPNRTEAVRILTNEALAARAASRAKSKPSD